MPMLLLCLDCILVALTVCFTETFRSLPHVHAASWAADGVPRGDTSFAVVASEFF